MMTTDERIWDAIAGDLGKRYGMKLRRKSGSRLMRFIGFIFGLFGRRDVFMNGFITTIGRTIYWPDDDFAAVNGGLSPHWGTLAHEGVHIHDYDKNPVWFVLQYTFPQVLFPLALLSLLAIPLSNWWLLNLLWLAALAPWPSAGRVKLERRGYRMSAMCDYLQHGRAYEMNAFYVTNYLAPHFYGPDYYFMCWDKNEAILFCYTEQSEAALIAQGIPRKAGDEPFTRTIDIVSRVRSNTPAAV